MSLIEEQFVLKTNGNEAYRVLVNFWSCIKIHVPNILSCVSQVFPHYTKHDASHSNAILDSVERILGKDAIEKLSVTDLWLLLCSAYYHDIGMYISGKEIEKCFKSDEFKKYIFDLKDDTKSPLNKYAVFFAPDKDKLNYNKCELTIDSYNSARYLLAAFFRDSHADRSEKFLQSDPSVIEMFSEIKRLITVIAEICRLHCAKFEEVMKFSEVENGVNGIEDYCHPRFVACMLRMGDLLDFDSSRVSKFSLDHLSSSIPSDSKIHNEKNYCITHALITPEKVDVYAECKEVEVAFEIDKWFTMIREEMSNQRNAWHDIASSTGIKGFPMCGTLETILLDHEKIDNKLKPKFEVDDEKAIKILQGSGLYNNKFDCIREILQNAVDATYLRIYLEKKNEFAKKELKEGFEAFLNICKQTEYQIEVRCKKREIENKTEKIEGKNKDEKKKYVWHFEIQDHGIGLQKSDLKYLMKIGSGKNNKDKFDIIKKMPEYAKPSGIFGIGFQSIFLIAEKVNIKSRYAFSDEVIDVDVGTPLKGGFALLKTKKDPFADKGTIISFDVMENILNDESYLRYDSYLKYDSYYNCFKESYDFLRNKKCDLEIARILNAVYKVIESSYLKICCYGDGVKDIEEKKEKRKYKSIYEDKEENLIVEISLNDENSLLKFGDGFIVNEGINVLYRNEAVNDHNLSRCINFLGLNINILSGNSDDILSVSRNALKTEYTNKIKEPIKKMIIQWLNEYWDKFNNDDKKTAALFIEYYGKEGEYEEKRKLWKKNKIDDIAFGKKLKYDSITITMNYYSPENEDRNNVSTQKIMGGGFYSEKNKFLGYVLKKYYHYGMHYKQFTEKRGANTDICVAIEFKKDSKDSIDWKLWLNNYRRMGNRSFMPCIDYLKLQVKEIKIPRIDSPLEFLFEKTSFPRTVCPYVVKDGKLEWDCSDEVVQWVRENNIDDKVTEDDIRIEYDEMKKVLDVYVKKINVEVDKKKANEEKDKKSKNVSELPKQVEKKTESKVMPKTNKTGKKQTKAKAKKS